MEPLYLGKESLGLLLALTTHPGWSILLSLLGKDLEDSQRILAYNPSPNDSENLAAWRAMVKLQDRLLGLPDEITVSLGDEGTENE